MSKKKKSLVGHIHKGWFRYFCYKRHSLIADIPMIVKYPKGKFYFSEFTKTKVRLTIQEL